MAMPGPWSCAMGANPAIGWVLVPDARHCAPRPSRHPSRFAHFLSQPPSHNSRHERPLCLSRPCSMLAAPAPLAVSALASRGAPLAATLPPPHAAASTTAVGDLARRQDLALSPSSPKPEAALAAAALVALDQPHLTSPQASVGGTLYTSLCALETQRWMLPQFLGNRPAGLWPSVSYEYRALIHAGLWKPSARFHGRSFLESGWLTLTTVLGLVGARFFYNAE